MTGVIEHRDPALVREELADLARYLNGVPEEIRSTGAFGAYDQEQASSVASSFWPS